MVKGLEWSGKVPGSLPLVLLLFLLVDLDLRLNLIYLKVELKVLVDFLFCDLIAWLPCTRDGSVKIRNVLT